MSVRGIRGATTVEQDEPQAILAATTELLQELFRANGIATFEEIASIIFTTTEDLRSVFPAEAARQLGLNDVPLLCSREIPVAGSTPRCIRVLVHFNTDRLQREIQHVYLREAKSLRPDHSERLGSQGKSAVMAEASSPGGAGGGGR